MSFVQNTKPVLLLAMPEDLPRSYENIVELVDSRIAHAVSLSVHRRVLPALSIHTRIGLLQASLPEREERKAERASSNGTADAGAHDDYCRIERVRTNNVAVTFIAAAIQAYKELIDEAASGGSTLDPAHWRALHASFECLLGFATGNSGAAVGWEELSFQETAWPAGELDDPLERWIVGHHVFLVLIQGLIIAVQCFQSAAASGSEEASRQSLEMATLLMHGSSAALHHGGDIPPAIYDVAVRPSMIPPMAPEGMSGVLARDHRHLVQLLQSGRSLVKGLGPQLQCLYGRFIQAFGGAFEAHKLVCAHLGGNQRPSILMTGEELSGVELLEELKLSRLRQTEAGIFL